MRALGTWGLLAVVCLGGCGASGVVEPRFPATPTRTVQGEAGLLVLDVYEPSNLPVARGLNTLRLVPRRLDEGALTGETLTVQPWMPAMGHGSSVTPTVEAQGGAFLVTDISFPMAGTWQLRCQFDGAVSDRATFDYQIQ